MVVSAWNGGPNGGEKRIQLAAQFRFLFGIGRTRVCSETRAGSSKVGMSSCTPGVELRSLEEAVVFEGMDQPLDNLRWNDLTDEVREMNLQVEVGLLAVKQGEAANEERWNDQSLFRVSIWIPQQKARSVRHR